MLVRPLRSVAIRVLWPLLHRHAAAVTADTAPTIAESRLILADVAENNNKFYTAKLGQNCVCMSWGRVGSSPVEFSKTFATAQAASIFYHRKLREKQSKGYTPQRIIFEDSGASRSRVAVSMDDVARDLLGPPAAEVARDLLEPGPPAVATVAAATTTVVIDAPTAPASPAPSATLERLVRALVAQNAHDITTATGGAVAVSSDGLARTPLGVVTEEAVAAARALLDRAAPRVAAGDLDLDAPWRTLLNEYLSAVPRAVGAQRPTPRSIFPDLDALRREHALLDSLAGSLTVLAARRAAAAADVAATAGSPRARIFDVALRVVGVDEPEDAASPSWANVRRGAPTENDAVVRPRDVFRSVRSLFHATARGMHASHVLRLRQLYRVDLRCMTRNYEAHGAPRGNVWRLWHGTRAGNLLSIFRSGLVVPPQNSPHVTGRLFGDGIYGTDCSTKALNYSFGAAPGQRGGSAHGDSACFAFLADFAMGRVFDAQSQLHSLPKPGFDSTWARGSQMGPSSLYNDEMIVYDAAQVRPVYLAEFERPSVPGSA